MEKIDLEQDALPTEIADGQLKRVSEVARKLINKQKLVTLIEENLKEEKELLKQIEENELPNLLQEVGITEFKMDSGEKVSMKQFYNARITPETGPKAYEWLRAHGFGDLIKHEIVIGIPMGKDDEAKTIISASSAQGLRTVDKEIVHPATLTSFVKEQIETGAELPIDLFNVFIGRKAKVVPPKE